MARAVFASFLSVFLVAGTVSAADKEAPAKPEAPRTLPAAPRESRPLALPPLYTAFAALQVYDVYSTLKGVKSGAVEANPITTGVAAHPAAFFAVKASVTAASIYAAERLWRDHHREQAIAIMVASNSVMAIVAARNAAVGPSPR